MIDPASVREFLSAADPDVRRTVIMTALESIESLRANVGQLTLAESFAAYQYEEATFDRKSLKRRLQQHMSARAGEIVNQYFTDHHGVEKHGSG